MPPKRKIVHCEFNMYSSDVADVIDYLADRVFDWQLVPVRDPEAVALNDVEADVDEITKPRPRGRPKGRKNTGVGPRLVLRTIERSSQPVDKSMFPILFKKRGLSPSNIGKILRQLVDDGLITQVGERAYGKVKNG